MILSRTQIVQIHELIFEGIEKLEHTNLVDENKIIQSFQKIISVLHMRGSTLVFVLKRKFKRKFKVDRSID